MKSNIGFILNSTEGKEAFTLLTQLSHNCSVTVIWSEENFSDETFINEQALRIEKL